MVVQHSRKRGLWGNLLEAGKEEHWSQKNGPLVQEEKGCWSDKRRNIGGRRKPLQPEEGS
jgi:hypothetical protein